jgi:hypothetical protein
VTLRQLAVSVLRVGAQSQQGTDAMAKGQKRSSKEVRKPKQKDKAKKAK